MTRALAAGALALLACWGLAAADADKREEVAQAAAEAWLKKVDAGEYGASWEETARLFRGAVTKEQWEQAMGASRAPLGKVVSRKLKSRKFSKTLPGAPDGQYVVIEYDSHFDKKAVAVETITPMRDPDGEWRVAGYFIR